VSWRPYRHPLLRWLFLLWWRLRERDVLDAREGETKGPPDYQYGKVSGLDPALGVITETSESPYVCCGYCAAGMAVWTARKGITHSMAGAAHPIRAEGGRPHDNGSRASELRDGAKRAHGVTLDALAVSEIPGVLRDGFAVVVNLDYAQLPPFLKVQGGSFGHSCCLYGWSEDRDLVGFFDPLWPEGAAGAWAPWSDVRDALWGDGEHSGTVTSWPAPAPEPEPEPEPEPVPCPPPDVTRDDLDAAVADAERATTLDRDRAWSGVTGLSKPRFAPAWSGTGDAGTRWAWFARWGPEPPAGSWNGASRWGDGSVSWA
jgi:hypothetical protein